MRSLLLMIIMAGLLPVAMMRPFAGILLWSWYSFMSPQRIVWGIAEDIPWGVLIVAATAFGCFMNGEPRRPRSSPTLWLLIAFIVATTLTSLVALAPGDAVFGKWSLVTKIFVVLIMTLLLTDEKERVHALIWVIVLSVGFYGVKGGAFSILTGGGHRVFGPEGTMINDNNSLAAALLMILPLVYYIRLQSKHEIIRLGCILAMVLIFFSILGSHSRGALVGIVCVSGYLWLKTQNKLVSGVAIGLLALMGLAFMPEHWWGRMATISTYADTQDLHNNRLVLWSTGWKLALARPFTGVGFMGPYFVSVVWNYVPGAAARSLHSIYFELMAEHGFPTFMIWLGLSIVGVRNARHIIRVSRGLPDLKWASDLARMVQVSIIAYLVTGAFLPLSYLDSYFTILVALAAARIIVDDTVRARDPALARRRPWQAVAAAPWRPGGATARVGGE
jgi:probable O-glycosylation ligase (exosortase A-associated)